MTSCLLEDQKEGVDAGEDEEKKEPSFTVGRIVNWYKQYGKQCLDSSKN